jgi:hypothetical protein
MQSACAKHRRQSLRDAAFVGFIRFAGCYCLRLQRVDKRGQRNDIDERRRMNPVRSDERAIRTTDSIASV